MKIRQGFVSNSSSSSFLIYGVYLDSEEVRKLCSREVKVEGEDECYVYEDLEEKLSGTSLSSYSPNYDSSAYIGVSWDKVKDDETGLQFKERVKRELESLGVENDPQSFQESWYS